jgi:hypothetical protein
LILFFAASRKIFRTSASMLASDARHVVSAAVLFLMPHDELGHSLSLEFNNCAAILEEPAREAKSDKDYRANDPRFSLKASGASRSRLSPWQSMPPLMTRCSSLGERSAASFWQALPVERITNGSHQPHSYGLKGSCTVAFIA